MHAVEEKAPDVFRHEVKYYLSRREQFILANYLRRVMRTDPHAGADGQYPIRSLYFDTPDDRDYYDKVAGLYERRKLRLRIYAFARDAAALELKTKRGALVQKRSVQLSRADAMRLIAGDYAFLCEMRNAMADRLYACFHRERLRPVILIDYKRQAFELPGADLRITIDTQLRASMDVRRLFDGSVACVGVMDGAQSILEVKYRSAVPGFIGDILSGIGRENASISKYVLSREAIHL